MTDEERYLAHCRQFIGKTAADFPGRYCETHHILAVHLGGGDEPENLVTMPYTDHIEAHRLLWLWCESKGNVGETAYIYLAMTQQLKGGRKGDLRRNPLSEDQLLDLERAKEIHAGNSRIRAKSQRSGITARRMTVNGSEYWKADIRLSDSSNTRGVIYSISLRTDRFSKEIAEQEALALRDYQESNNLTIEEGKEWWGMVRLPELTGRPPRPRQRRVPIRAINLVTLESAIFPSMLAASKFSGCDRSNVSSNILYGQFRQGVKGVDGSRWMFEYV